MEQNLEYKELWSKTQNTRNYEAKLRKDELLWSRTLNTRNYCADPRIEGILQQKLEKMNYCGAEP